MSPEVLHATLRRFFDAIGDVAPARIAACFAEDGEIEDPVGSDVVRGRNDIERSFTTGLAITVASAKIDVVAAMPIANRIAAHWRMRARTTAGKEAEVEGIDVLHVNERGEIVRAEGYWDPQAFKSAFA